jgi:hypothetical protein
MNPDPAFQVKLAYVVRVAKKCDFWANKYVDSRHVEATIFSMRCKGTLVVGTSTFLAKKEKLER